jgi:HAD superfamily hydrolase (TIGR01509 family)
MYKALLFDFDGTLTPSLPLWVKAFQDVLAHYDIDVSEEVAASRCLYRPWDVIARDFGLHPGDDFNFNVVTSLQKLYLEAVLYPFAYEMLDHCRKHRLLIALVTSSPRAVVGDTIIRLGLSGFFSTIVTADDVCNYKPHPEPVLNALDLLGVPPSDALMIGDSEADIRAGDAAGTFTALFTPHDNYTFSHLYQPRSIKPNFVFSDLAELPLLLGLPDLEKYL